MRTEVFDRVQGSYQFNLRKAIGKGYDKAWFTNCICRYRIFCSARSTKKSVVILGYEPIIKILSDERRNVLVVRQNDSDNRQSTFENICGRITDMALDPYFKINKNPLEIIYKPTGQKIIFRGLNNPTSLNSITFSVGFLTDVYIEEAFEVSSYADFRKLDGSLRGKMPEGLIQQITLCLNAWSQDCWIYQEFFRGNLEDDFEYLDNNDYMDYYNPEWIGPYGTGLYLHKATYKINEFRDTENYDRSALEMKKKAPLIYSVEFLGMRGNATAATYPEFNDSCFINVQQALNMQYGDFAIGIDTGLSSGDGHRKVVKKGQDVELRIKSATTMQLVGVTADNNKIVAIDEYFHSNDSNFNSSNTDNRENLTMPQLADSCMNQIIKWIDKYNDRARRGNLLMKGMINCYVDNADIGFRQVMEMKANEYGIYNIRFVPSTKISIQSRVDFERLMFAYSDMVVVRENCPNLIRELKNSRHGEKGEPRADSDDHAINAFEYGFTPMRNNVVRWKTFKEH